MASHKTSFQTSLAPSALNSQPGRWLIDTQSGMAAGRVPTPIMAGPLLQQMQAERDSLHYQAEIDAFVAEHRAVMASRRAAPANMPPAPTQPMDDVCLPASFGETMLVVGTAIAGVSILAALLTALARVIPHAWGG